VQFKPNYEKYGTDCWGCSGGGAPAVGLRRLTIATAAAAVRSAAPWSYSCGCARDYIDVSRLTVAISATITPHQDPLFIPALSA
jgi:hypothetical protein